MLLVTANGIYGFFSGNLTLFPARLAMTRVHLQLRFKGESVLESQAVNERKILVLASNSPRRQQLLALGGWLFDVLVADVDESQLPGEAPGDYVLRVAEMKARKSAEKIHDARVIVAADTSVVDGEDILGKPVDERDAVRMLKRLRGHSHQVYTGLALLRKSDGHSLITDLTVTDVPMRDYSDKEIDAYVQTGDPLDKAGAYAIQHPRFHPVDNLEGCFASVMGLPLCRLAYLLQQFEITPEASVGIRCQAELQYDCPISSAVLRGELVK
jgi:MAF protein